MFTRNYITGEDRYIHCYKTKQQRASIDLPQSIDVTFSKTSMHVDFTHTCIGLAYKKGNTNF